jgi:hypothetical protein
LGKGERIEAGGVEKAKGESFIKKTHTQTDISS